MARSDRKQSPDFGNIYLYVNALPKIVRDSATYSDNLYSLTLRTFRYHFSSDGRCIVYKKKHTETVNGIDYTGYVYYVLGSQLNVIKDFGTWARSADVFVRGGVKSRLDGSNSEMYRSVSDISFFESDYTQLTMGGSGNNGGYGGSTNQPNYADTSLPTFIKHISTDTITLGTVANNTTLWLGLEPNVYNVPVRYDFYKKASSTYVSGSNPWACVRHVPWIWSNNGSDDINTWGELYSFIFNTTYASSFTENVTTVEDIYDGEPRFLNVYVSENYDACIDYINRGVVPSDATIIVSDDDGVPQLSKDDGNDDSANPEEKGNPDDDTQSNPNHSIPSDDESFILGSVNNYFLTKNELNSFISWFWNESITTSWTDVLANTLSGMYGNLTQCITSIKKMPVPTQLYQNGTRTSSVLKVGRYTYSEDGLTFQFIKGNALESTLVGTIDIEKKYNNFVDFAPYTALQMYLPYVGIIPLDTNLVMGRTIKVYAIASVYTSEIQYTLHASKDGIDTLIGVYVGKCGIDVPFSLDDAGRIFSNVANNISGAISSLSGINLPDIGGTSAPMNVSMQASNQLSVFTPEKCCLIAKRKRYQLPSNYGSKVGWKCCKKFGLYELVGYTVVENPIIKRWNGTSPTQAEIDEIYALLSSGVIL